MVETSNHPRRVDLGNPNRNLNDLPKEILVHILSFLLTVDAIRSCLISRKWRPLWSLVPSLNFYFSNYDVGYFFRNPTDEDDRAPLFNPFVDLVDRVLNTRPLDSPSLQSFRLSFPYFDEYVSQVDSWISCAVTRLRARELHLDFCFDTQFHDFNDSYAFPFSVLRNGCVQVFSLMGSSLALPADISTIRSLGSLRSVYLKQIIDLTDEMVRNLTLGCPNLEDLELQTCEWLENLSICSTSLKKLVLEYDYFTQVMHTFEVDCPNLRSMRLHNCGFAHYVLNNATSLVEVWFHIPDDWESNYDLWTKIVGLLEQAPYLNKLNMQNLWSKLILNSEDPFPTSFMLQNLNHLELRTGYTQYDRVGMAALLCPNLETMVLDKLKQDESLPEELLNKPVEFKIPRLKQVTMKTYAATEDERNFVTILKKQAVHVVLEKLD